MFKYCITGQCGLIGSALKKRLDDEGNKCILEMDLKDDDDIYYNMPIEKYRANIMFHLASNCKINKCIDNPNWCFDNVMGIHNVLEFCRRNNIKKIVTFSSSRVLSPERNPYTAGKMYMEELCKSYFACYNIQYVIIRPSTVYGPFDDKTHRLIDIWIRNALNGDNLKIYGDPKTKTLDFTYIDDFIDGVMLILKDNQWNKSYNLSGGEEYNLKKLADLIIKETESPSMQSINGQSPSKIIIKPAEIQQPQKIRLNISEMKKIGYCPRVTLKEGVKRTIKFYKKHKLR